MSISARFIGGSAACVDTVAVLPKLYVSKRAKKWHTFSHSSKIHRRVGFASQGSPKWCTDGFTFSYLIPRLALPEQSCLSEQKYFLRSHTIVSSFSIGGQYERNRGCLDVLNAQSTDSSDSSGDSASSSGLHRHGLRHRRCLPFRGYLLLV